MVVLLAAASAGAWWPRSARACSPGLPPDTAALPGPGAASVSPATSLIVFGPRSPSGLTLLANGQNVPLSPATSLGSGVMGSGTSAGFWRLGVATADGMLVAGAEHVLSQAKGDGTTAELTRFTTAAAYDKAPGTAPVLRGVRLWRVRYPVADIASGNCVSAEYHGFLTVDYEPATVPNTPAASVVHTFELAPRTGGSKQTFVYAADTPFVGRAPEGAYPTPTGQWQPELDPTREYCLSVAAFGDGDLARPALRSQPVCAEVVQLSAPGAPGGGGCAVAGAASSVFAVWLLLVVALTLGARGRGPASRARALGAMKMPSPFPRRRL